jgi:diguanylate cyclase (GGDEF)-like protein
MSVAKVVLVVGLGGSAVGALEWHGYVRTQQQTELRTTTNTAAVTLTSELQRDEDLVRTVRALVASNPSASNTELQAIFTNLGPKNYAGTLGLAYIERVPAGQLAQYRAVVAADPPLGVPSSGAFVLDPPGSRAQYCLGRLIAVSPNVLDTHAPGVSRVVGVTPAEIKRLTDPGYDYCQSSFGPLLAAVTERNVPTVNPLAAELAPPSQNQKSRQAGIERALRNGSPMEISMPVYRTGAPIATAADRRAALLGWTGSVFDPDALTAPVLAAAPNLSLSLSYANPTGPRLRVLQAGLVVPGSSFRTIALRTQGDWTVRIGLVPTVGSATVQALGVLVAGVVLSLLLFFLLASLARSRASALEIAAEKTQELRHRSLHDPLTGLPNRDLIIDRADRMLTRARRDQIPLAALFIDLDGFNGFNDTFGHAAGDHLLKAIASRLTSALRASDTVGRVGGDEFVVLAEGMSVAAGPEVIARHILDVLAEPHAGPRHGAALRVTASIGIAWGQRSSAEDLLRDADIALHAAKAAGKNRFVVFEPEMHTAVRGRLDLELDLRMALDDDQFFLVYQPIFDLEGVTFTGLEALLRWQHPRRGVVAPNDFIPLLEETGMIVQVGREVLAQACRQTRRWHQRGYPVNVSINVSALQLESDDFFDDVRRALHDTGLDPRALTLEMTESALMRDAQTAVSRLTELKTLGVALALDDFGTGYSSLSYLRQFPIDVLKIDRSFVSGLGESAEGAALVHTMVQLGQALRLRTVAEGIETEEQLHLLQAEGCVGGQGFLLARPVTSTEVERFFGRSLQQFARPSADLGV